VRDRGKKERRTRGKFLNKRRTEGRWRSFVTEGGKYKHTNTAKDRYFSAHHLLPPVAAPLKKRQTCASTQGRRRKNSCCHRAFSHRHLHNHREA